MRNFFLFFYFIFSFSKLYCQNSIGDTTYLSFKMPTYWNIKKIHNNKLYVLNKDSNILYVKDLVNGNSNYERLNALINENISLVGLKLNSVDLVLTESNLLKSKKINSLLKINNINFNADEILLSCSVSYIHYANKDEVAETRRDMKDAGEKYNFGKNDTTMKLLVNKNVILNYNMKSKNLRSLIVPKEDKGYITESISGCYFQNQSQEIYIPVNYYGETKDSNEYFKRNILYTTFVVDWSTENIEKKSKASIKRPKYFAEKNKALNYSNGNFLSSSHFNLFYLSSYPYFVDLNKSVVYEVPIDQLTQKKLKNKKDRLGKFNILEYHSIGICSNQSYHTLLGYYRNKELLAFQFDMSGNFLNTKTIMKVDYGSVICDGNQVYLLWLNKGTSTEYKLIRLKIYL